MANWRSAPKGDISENSCSNFQSSKEEGCFVSKQLTGSNKKFSKDDTLEQVESDKRKGLDKANSQGNLEDKTAGAKDSNGADPVKQFDCSCGRKFETQRGLSLHLSHQPDHKPEKKDMPIKQSDSTHLVSEPLSPLPSPGSAPSSPYNYSSFKTSARNPQYYSIIRTRSSSGTEETGTKRVRGSTAGAPPPKAIALNSGERTPVTGEVSEDSDKESPLHKRRNLKDTRGAKQAARPCSLSNSEASPEHDTGLQKSSPVTRSNSATMKAPEFISLPSRRRRGGRRGGRGSRGAAISGRGSADDNEIDEDSIGENFPPSPLSQTKSEPSEVEPPVKRKRGRPPKNRKEPTESPQKKAAETGKKQFRKEQGEELLEEPENKPSDEALPTKAGASESEIFKNVTPKKGGSKEGEKEITKSGSKTRKSAQKMNEEISPANEVDEDPAPKRTRSKSKPKEPIKSDKERDLPESNKEEKDADKTDQAPPTSQAGMVNTASEGKPPNEENTEKSNNSESRRPSVGEPLVPTSSPTGYLHPYHYPGPYPHPPPIMYPPAPPSSYHPYYGYPGGPSGGYHVPPPPPGMVIPPHPGSPMGELPPGAPYPPPSSSTQNTSGVQVSVLDKPPTQMPTVTLPPPQGRPRSMYPMEGGPAAGPLSPQAMMRPPYLGIGSPEEMAHPLSHTYRPGVMPPMPGYPPLPQGPYHHHHPHLAVRLDHSGMPYMDWAPEHKPPPPEDPPARPVECPECGRMFKNNKALNGHMRLHGGFDWTKKPYTAPEYSAKHAPLSMTKPASSKASEDSKQNTSNKKTKPSNKRSRSNSRSRSPTPGSGKSNNGKGRRSSEDKKRASKDSITPLPVPRAPTVFTFDKVEREGDPPQGRNATLDDLCRAAELLDSMEGRSGSKKDTDKQEEDSEPDENGRRRPKNITIPQTQSTPVIERDRLRLGGTPPYTPPPILSPSRSMTMLAGGPGTAPGTPCRILSHWSSRRSSDGHPLSESEESYNEPRINVGREFQADLPSCSESNSAALASDPQSVKVWQAIEELTPEDEATIDGYLEIACSPAVLHSGRNKELSLHLLYQLGGSVKEAVRCLLSSKTVFPTSHSMTGYNYCGTGRWTPRERQQFRRAWRVHRKQFQLIKSAVESKKMSDIVEYYYTWKKYCSDEYRGRSRHFSEEILSDEETAELRSSSSEASGDHETPPFTHSGKKGVVKVEQIASSLNEDNGKSQEGNFDHLPIVYAPHTSQPLGQSHHQYKCKYPGCNQIFTSIFALNGHIRVHGGSFYPKPGANSKPSSLQNSTHTAFAHGKPSGNKLVESRSQQQLELAKALLELPQPRSPARKVGYHTPSPKPSPKSRSPGGGVKKKLSSASPGEREGFYPCNRCGRVFTKVKSRSAHMKSHIVKQN